MPSALQVLVKSRVFTLVGYLFILLNCFVLALYSPLEKTPFYLKVLNLFVDAFFCTEFVLRMIAFGSGHFTSIGKKFDLAVTAVSLGDIILFIIRQFVDVGGNAVRYLQLIRVMSVFRPLGMLQFFPPTSEHGKIIPAVYDLIVTAVIPLLALIVFCMMTFGLVDDSIYYRCVPTDFSATEVTENEFYQEYGVDYFYSEYNVMYCGYKLCENGFSCVNTQLPYAGVYASFLDPWQALISNMAFVTMRGWPNIFWAIHDSAGVTSALIILVVIFCVGTLLLFNMYIAVFVGFLKDNIKSLERLVWLQLYPGNLETVTELEVLLWAKRNLSPVEMTHNLDLGVSVRTLLSPLFDMCWGTNKKTKSGSAKYSALPRSGLDAEGAGVEMTIRSELKSSKKEKAKKKVEDIEDDLMQNKDKIRFCVPNCSIFKVTRRHVRDPSSTFSMIILGLILLDILLFAMNSVGVHDSVERAIYYGNVVLASIFGLEMVLYLIVMGPFLYFNSLFNILDFTCVILTLASLRYGGCRYANIFRILRIFRPFPTRVQGTLMEELAWRKHIRDTSLHFDRLTELLYLSFRPMLKYMTLQYVAIFVFSLIAMRIFPFDYGDSININSSMVLNDTAIEPITPNNETEKLSMLWSGQYQNSMNFNIFSNSYQTTFDLLYLNSWYYVMVNNMLKTGVESFWFFFIWIFFSNYILAPVLAATLIVGVERQSVAMLKTISYENKKLFERLQYYKKKSELYRFFHMFKRNTQAIGGNQIVDAHVVQRNEIREAEDEDMDRDTWWQKVAEHRREYSCGLFAPKGFIRRFTKWTITSAWFNMIVLVAVVITIIDVLSTASEAKSADVTLSVYCLIVFFTEMFFKWITYGVYNCFNHLFRNIDFLLNLLILYHLASGETQYSGFLIVRIIKFPAMIYHISQSKSLNILLRGVKQSYRSIATVTSLLLISCLFFAVLGLNLYKGGFGYCSYSEYPGGRHKHDRTGAYPNGCDGLTSITDSTTGDVTTELLYWVQPIDNFDSIFSAGKSVFRVVMMNDWAGIMLSAVSYVGTNIQPIRNYNTASFLYFMFASGLATVFNILFACVIYFHYYTEMLMADSNSVLSQDEVIWIQLNVALKTCEPFMTPKLPTLNDAPVRYYLMSFMKSTPYKVFSLCFAFTPVVLLLAFYNLTYHQNFMLYIDNLFSVAYIFDYLIRLYVVGQWKIWSTADGVQEIIIVAFLVVSIASIISADAQQSGFGNCREIVFACIIIRFYRLSVIFPSIAKFCRIFVLTLRGFLPLVGTIFALLIFYGVIACYAFDHLDLGFSNYFLAEHYNFNGYFNSMITLLAMSTGNFYTEVITAIKDQSDQFEDHVATELFFTSYYLLMNIFIRATVLICVTKYLSESGDSAYAANEQINHFKRVWRRLKKPSHDPNYIKHKKVREFLASLKYPLGIKGTKDSTTFVVIERFKQKVLRYTEKNMKEQERRLLFMLSNSGREDTVVVNQKELDQTRYTFNELILAAHRNYVINEELPDEQEFQENRLIHRRRLKLFRLHLAMLILSGRARELKDVTLKAAQLQLMLQRFDPELYKETFLRLMNFIHTYLSQMILSIGFEDFYGFVIIYIRKAVLNEYRSAEMQVKKHQLLAQSGTNKQVQVELRAALAYYAGVFKLNKLFDTLYNRHIQQFWDVESIFKLCTVPEAKSAVTSIALDSLSNFYVAFDSGKVKVYRNNSVNGRVLQDTQYRLNQTMDYKKAKVAAIAVTYDGKKLYIAVNNTVLLLSSQKSKKKKVNYEEISQMKFHSGTVNAIELFGGFILTGSSDGYVALWPVGGVTPLQTCYFYSSVFCLTVLKVADESAVADEILLSDVLVIGHQSGDISMLPLPLTKNSVKEGDSWTYSSLIACPSPVSSMCSAWGFLYVGCADGIVHIFAKLTTKEGTPANPIAAVNLVKVSMQTVHAGAITGMVYSGGHLISASHDYSILPWTPPTKLSAKTSNEFHQDMCGGVVFHETSIVAMASNSKVVVSGDDLGNVVVTAPVTSQEILSSDKALGHNSAKKKAHFSFLEHDFKECICNHKGAAIEEEVYLNITNISCLPITVRAVPKGGKVFAVTPDTGINLALGCKVVCLPSIFAGTTKAALEIPVGGSAQFRMTFNPVEADKHYASLYDFVIDGTSVVKVNLKGVGMKPVVRLDNVQQIIDFDLVEVDAEPKTIVITLFNQCNRDVVMNLNDSPVRDEHSSTMHTLASRHILVEPRCFFMERKSTVKVTLTYAPSRAMLAFDLPLKFNVAGASYTMANLRTRSRRKYDVALRTTTIDESSRLPDLVGFTEKRDAKAFPGLRLLTSVENHCPGDSVNSILSSVGWGVGYQYGMLCLMHLASGLFFHVPRGQMIDDIDDEEDSPELTRKMHGNSSVEVQFLCTESQFYELWIANRRIYTGACEADKICTVTVKATDVYALDENGEPRALYGAQVLELYLMTDKNVTANKASGPTLKSITYINVQKGYVVRAPVIMQDPFKLVEQLDMIGIHKVTTFLDNGTATLFENFDQMLVENTKAKESSAVFGNVKLSLNPKSVKDVTHYEVRDTINLINPDTGDTDRDIEQNKIQPFENATDLEIVDVKLPELGAMGSELNGVVRGIVVKMIKKGRDTAGKATHAVLSRVETEVHTMKYASQTPNTLAVNQTLTRNALNGMLPTVIHSCQHSVAVKLPDKSDSTFTTLQNQIRSGFDFRFHEENSIHNNRYFFVVDNSKIKLLSANPTWPIMIDNTAIQGDDASVAVSKKSVAKSVKKEEPSAPMPQFSSFELELNSLGALVILDDFDSQLKRYNKGSGDDDDASLNSAATGKSVSTAMSSLQLSVDNGIASMRNVMKNVAAAVAKQASTAITLYADGVIDFQKGVVRKAKSKRHLHVETSKTVKVTSITGATTRLEEAPKFLSHSWDTVVASVLSDNIKDAFKKLMIRYESNAKNVENAKSFSARMYHAMLALTNEHHDKFVAEKNRAAGLNVPPPKPSTTLNVTKLHLYMETVPLPGSDVVMSKAQIEIGLRALQVDVVGNIAQENIRVWFDSKATKRELQNLNERTVYARLLVEDIEDILAWSVTSGAAETADDSDEEIEEEIDLSGEFKRRRLPRVDTTLSNKEDTASRRRRMTVLWNQRLNTATKRGKHMKANRFTASYMALSESPDGLREKLLAKLKDQNAKSGRPNAVHSPRPHGVDDPPDSARSSVTSEHSDSLPSSAVRPPVPPTPAAPLAPLRPPEGSIVSDITTSNVSTGFKKGTPGLVKKQVSIKLPTIQEPQSEGSEEESEESEEEDSEEESSSEEGSDSEEESDEEESEDDDEDV